MLVVELVRSANHPFFAVADCSCPVEVEKSRVKSPEVSLTLSRGVEVPGRRAGKRWSSRKGSSRESIEGVHLYVCVFARYPRLLHKVAFYF